ncbi:putative bifunctional dethiobiotin synthetase adenosylmethionine-8-amino-7-oxononanoate aminotransferase [Rosellinia necatrix]|uniref:Putative bifunctional dethiobiotin synthetase adenosylmethionine-8-amino-7-oxononanoate aminotransferase n=1 Tax=Rosellinia necatrix TaxID=77044 RepID=A0A1S7UM90_ROSNE|nr:putative bifunctional dethiobiotin synthetase adenosylmethionine-8-amino-7-oxononanoate aminotransferase [Rosellinia necatrix]
MLILSGIESHIRKFTKGVAYETLYQYGQAVSPHIAAQGNVVSNGRILESVYDFASRRASIGPGWLFIETAGGVHSPAPSGTTQADLYSVLRCPVVLVGDWKLGGISSTISAFESLRMRGYDVESIILFEDDSYGNSKYLKEYFGERYGVTVAALPMPPARNHDDGKDKDEKSMLKYYLEKSRAKGVRDILTRLDDRHSSRIKVLEDMAPQAHKRIWYPFTQQELLQVPDIVTIDSAHGNHFQTLASSSSPTPTGKSLLRPSFDGSASWWTQGLGHGNSALTMAAAYAAGRYGHVMFAGTVHEPALKLATVMLESVRNPRLSRVFLSDNGSTGMEVAVKMALRAARVRYGWPPDAKIDILGLKGSYHGDTIGAMSCAEPNIYNEKVEWYEGKGVWLDYPQILCVAGKWQVQVPPGIVAESGLSFSNISDVFDLRGRIARGEHKYYERYILSAIRRHLEQGRKFGALILEPVVLGAGGMVMVDPLFQQTLIEVVRQNASLFGPDTLQSPLEDPNTWRGLPVVFDEVFTGLYRLGRLTAASFLGVQPDISVHAKLLTGGLVPLCVTLASELIFNAFASQEKSDALLHGHSYTAHPVGCQVAIESLKQLQLMERTDAWGWAKSKGWTVANDETRAGSVAEARECIWSIWPLPLVEWMSFQTNSIAGAWAIGSVLAIHLQAADGSGYASIAAEGLRKKLLAGRSNAEGLAWNVHSRVLGNVLYIMGSQGTTKDEVREISDFLQVAIKEL